jgi:PAS domain S-box-containing protein
LSSAPLRIEPLADPAAHSGASIGPSEFIATRTGAAGVRSDSVLHSQEMSDNAIDAWLAAVVDASDDAIVTTTLDGVIRSWNRGAERLFGYTAGEAVGQQIFLIIPSDRIAEEQEVLARLRRGERIDHFETIRQAKDGRRVPISLTVSPVWDDQGNLIGASKVARDIRMRLQRDDLLARLAAIVQSSDDAIVGKTLDGVITSWNEGAERLFGYTADEAVGQPIFLIIPEDRRLEEEDVLSRLRRGERIKHFETIRQAKEGRRVPVSLSVSPIRDEQGRIIGAAKVARDISDRVERERMQLLTHLVLAHEDERARMARELHDELGQQMTALRLTLETLKAATLDRHDLRAQIDMLQEMARQLDADVAFRVRGLRSAILETRGLAAALREYVGNWSQHSHVPLRLHTNVSGDDRLPPEVESTMYRVAQEALNNVLKHARARHVDLALERHADHVSLIIEDDGVGFDAAKAANDVRGVGGFGLVGMRERAALIGADLQIESTVGRGTTIFVRVPVADIPRA